MYLAEYADVSAASAAKLPAESEAVSEASASNSLTYYQENHLFYDNIGWNGHMHSFVSAIQILWSYCVFILINH